MNSQYILYGAGNRCSSLCEIAYESEIKVVAVVDSDSAKWGKKIGNYIIDSPEIIANYEDAVICITVADVQAKESIKKSLKKICRDNFVEINYSNMMLELYKSHRIIRETMKNLARNDKESILFDCSMGLVLGGVEAWSMAICKELLKQKEKEIYLISDSGEYEVDRCLDNQVIKTQINQENRFSLNFILDMVANIAQYLPCKVVTSMVDEVMIAAYLIKAFYPDWIEVISVIHNSNAYVYESYNQFQVCSDRYVAVSHDIIENMKKIIPSKKVDFMTLPFECEEHINRTYTINKEEPIRIGFAGRIVIEQKRVDLLVKIIENLVLEDITFQMEIAGDGIELPYMREKLSELGVLNKVLFLGRIPREEMKDFWKDKDIYINISDYEGNCITKLEAMGNGVVPVVTNTSGTKENIVDGINGYIVKVGDYVSIVEKIKYLSLHREMLEIMGSKAHDMVYPKSTMKTHMELWERLLFS